MTTSFESETLSIWTARLQAAARALSVAAVLLFVSGASFAQGMRMSAEERKAAFDANFEELKTTLVLDEETSPKVKEILWTQQEKMMEMMSASRGGGQMARQGMRQKMQELNGETRTALAAVLTTEQLESYDAFQAERRNGRGGRGQGQRRTLPQ